MSDPYAVLGIEAGATVDDVAAAYRELAKRHHPDRAPADGERMREINAAYDEIVRRAVAEPATAAARASRPRTAARTAPAPGAWLAPRVRQQLGRELLESLQPHEDVLLVADAASWDSPSVRLVVTDRRLLWLRDDAPVARVRFVSYALLESVEGRVSRRRRQAELRVKPRDARRLSFAAMTPEVLDSILRLVRPRLRGARPAASRPATSRRPDGGLTTAD